MTPVFTSSADEKGSMEQWLGARGIPFQLRYRTEVSGVDVVDFMIGDGDYDRACAAVDEFEGATAEEYLRTSSLRCPACGSARVRTIVSDQPQTLIKLSEFHLCEDCGNPFVLSSRSSRG